MPEGSSAGELVLFAYDGSKFAKAAIEEGGRQLRTGRRALVLTVVTPFESIPFWGAPFSAMSSEIAEEIFGRATTVAEEGTELARGAGFAAEPLVDRGSPTWMRIVDVADENEAGIIVLGSHGHTGLSYVLMGSVASAVAHHATRPVLIARTARTS